MPSPRSPLPVPAQALFQPQGRRLAVLVNEFGTVGVDGDILRACAPEQLTVYARYTRRGGLDINPWRITPGWDAGITAPIRELRQ